MRRTRGNNFPQREWFWWSIVSTLVLVVSAVILVLYWNQPGKGMLLFCSMVSTLMALPAAIAFYGNSRTSPRQIGVNSSHLALDLGGAQYELPWSMIRTMLVGEITMDNWEAEKRRKIRAYFKLDVRTRESVIVCKSVAWHHFEKIMDQVAANGIPVVRTDMTKKPSPVYIP